MNLLMILLIFLAIWICGAICFFAWRVMPDVNAPQETAQTPATESSPDTGPVPPPVDDTTGQ